jgi:hypothetical protein
MSPRLLEEVAVLEEQGPADLGRQAVEVVDDDQEIGCLPVLLEHFVRVVEQEIDPADQLGRIALEILPDLLAPLGAADHHRFQACHQAQAEPVQSRLALGLGLSFLGDLRLDLIDLLQRHLGEPVDDIIDQAFVQRSPIGLELPHQLVDEPEEQVAVLVVFDQRIVGVEVQRRETIRDLVLKLEELRGLASAAMAGERDLGEAVGFRVVVLQALAQLRQLVRPAPARGDVHIVGVA